MPTKNEINKILENHVQKIQQRLMEILPLDEWEVQIVEEYDYKNDNYGEIEVSYKKCRFYFYFTHEIFSEDSMKELAGVALSHLQSNDYIKIVCKLRESRY